MLADLEFTQFHPTAVVGLKGKEGFLISEAVRGEGATLHGPDGERFVDELDPRDAVARAIFRLLQTTGATSVGLDMTMVDPGRFPNVVAALQEAGLDPTTQRVPVAPASHYVMGGIVTDLDGRATGVERLYAVGECACTGLHGANRLASNSLSECFVFGRRAALAGLDEPTPGRARAPTPATPIEPPSRETREAVWRHAGLERSEAGLDELAQRPVPARPARRGLREGPRTRRAARTPAPSTPSSTPRSTAATRSSTPAPRRRDSRRGPRRAPDRLGRRPDDEHDGLVRRLRRPRGPARARGPAGLPRRPAGARRADRARVRPDRHRRRSRRASPPRSTSSPTDLARRLTATVAPDHAMRDAVRRFHDHGVRTALVSNSWRHERLRRRLDLFDASSSRASSASANPTRRSTSSRSSGSASPPSAASSSTTSGATSSPQKPWV